MAQQRQHQHTSRWTPPWITAIADLLLVVVVCLLRGHIVPFSWWGLPIVAVIGVAATVPITVVQGGDTRTHAFRTVVWLTAGGWATWATLAVHTPVVAIWATLILLGGSVILAGLSYLCRPPVVVTQVATDARRDPGDRRPAPVREWATLLSRLTKEPVNVSKVVDWANPADGVRVHVDLPFGMTWRALADVCDRIQAARKLPIGCAVRVLEGADQGEAVLDVMLRDCLADPVTLKQDYTRASINDEFTVMTSPRGEDLKVCLRQQSMIVGGAVESGKTTLLHRLILHLARCVDAVIWVIDLNGGGAAEPFIAPWARGEAPYPLIDWVAADEDEAAVMVAVANAVIKDRKTHREAVRRMRAANDSVLPVDHELPAIILLVDEGGEVRQAASVFGQLVATGLSRFAQIGRATAGRVVVSILRGTSEMLDKGLRVQAAIRLSLRMMEDTEYTHVLGVDPGRTRLVHKGSAYLYRSTDLRPIFGRTVNILRDAIEQAAVACAHLRPRAIREDRIGDIDVRGQQVAARVRAVDVMAGRLVTPEILALPVMADVEAGRAYEGRWSRFEPRLREMRGDEALDPDDAPVSPRPTVVAPAAPTAGPGPALANFLASVGMAQAPQAPTAAAPAPKSSAVDLDDDMVDREAARLLGWLDGNENATETEAKAAARPVQRVTTREHILAILRDAYPQTLTSDQIGTELDQREAGVHRVHRQSVLKVMREAGEIVQEVENGPYSWAPSK